ncbi:MAG TPA: hypothetical protein VLF62_01800 [Candidatus Saccharimonadales bacterium]|nr:hypothetical protein [Candidatus Saccharimonadales bacterium]
MAQVSAELARNNPFRRIVANAALLVPRLETHTSAIGQAFIGWQEAGLGILDPGALARYALAMAARASDPKHIIEAVSPWATPIQPQARGGDVARVSISRLQADFIEHVTGTSILVESPSMGGHHRTGVRLFVGAHEEEGPVSAELAIVETVVNPHSTGMYAVGKLAVLDEADMRLLDHGRADAIGPQQGLQALVPLMDAYDNVLASTLAGIAAGTAIQVPFFSNGSTH